MAEFKTKLYVEDNDGFPFTLTAPLIYQSDELNTEITVPVGFNTDYASIPTGVQLLLPKVGKYDRAAVVHDFLYQTQPCQRGQADNVLKEAMKVLHVPGWRLYLIYAGVRAGGWAAWRKDAGKMGKALPDKEDPSA